MAATWGPRRPRGGGLVDRPGRGCPPWLDLRLRVPEQDRRGSSLAGEPDRRPSRRVVSPAYAQGSYYGTNRVVASAPGRFTGPAAPLLSTARAAQPSGRDRRRSRSSVVRTGRVSRKNPARGGRGPGRGGPDAGRGTRHGARHGDCGARVAVVRGPASAEEPDARRAANRVMVAWARAGRRTGCEGRPRAPTASATRPRRAECPPEPPCYDPAAVLGGELAVPCTCNPL
jgi:hypothetical protein